MKSSLAPTVLGVLVLQIALTACQPGNNTPTANENQIQTLAAGANTTFLCATDDGVPATIARTPEGDTPLIRWKSEFFNKWGWTPQKRCEEVSEKFQRFKDSGELNTLSTGEIDGVPVLCVTTTAGGNCGEFLFTLEPNEDPETILKRLTDPNVTTLER